MNDHPGQHNEQEPVRVGDLLEMGFTVEVDGPEYEDTSVTCRHCGQPIWWYRTKAGRWIPIEPTPQPTHLVPPGRRWRLTATGMAINLGHANPADLCYVTHIDRCPARSGR